MVVVDLWGLAPINFDYEISFYISFLESYSRYAWIYFLSQKKKLLKQLFHLSSKLKGKQPSNQKYYRQMEEQSSNL